MFNPSLSQQYEAQLVASVGAEAAKIEDLPDKYDFFFFFFSSHFLQGLRKLEGPCGEMGFVHQSDGYADEDPSRLH